MFSFLLFEGAPGFDTSFVTKIREANAKDLEGCRYDQSYNGRLFQFDQDFEQNQATFKELGGASILMPEDQGGFGTGILGVHGNTVYMMTRSDMGEPVAMEIFNMDTKTFTPLDTIAIPEYWDGFGMTNRRGCCVEPPTFSGAVSADGGSLFIAGPVDEPKEFTHARLYSMPSKAKVVCNLVDLFSSVFREDSSTLRPIYHIVLAGHPGHSFLSINGVLLFKFECSCYDFQLLCFIRNDKSRKK